MTQTTISKLQSNTFLLDEAFGVLKGDVETLKDVVGELMSLAQDMDETNINHVKTKFIQWNRKTKILSKLLYHTVENLEGESTAAHGVHMDIFNSVQELDKEKALI